MWSTSSEGSLGRRGSAAASWYSRTHPTERENAGIGAVVPSGAASESSVSPSGSRDVDASHSGGGGGGGGAVEGGGGGGLDVACCFGVRTMLEPGAER